MDAAEFGRLLECLCNTENIQALRVAENRLNQLKKEPSVLIPLLLKGSNPNSGLSGSNREMAVVLFRRVYFHSTDGESQLLWVNASQELKEGVKAHLLNIIELEPVNRIRRLLCDLIFDLATFKVTISSGHTHNLGTDTVYKERWDALPGTLLKWTDSTVVMREAAFTIIANYPQLFGDNLDAKVGEIYTLLDSKLIGPAELVACMNSADHLKSMLGYQLAVTKALCSCGAHMSEKVARNLGGLLIKLLSITNYMNNYSVMHEVQTIDLFDDHSCAVLIELTELAESTPSFYKQCLDLVYTTLLPVFVNIPDYFHQLAGGKSATALSLIVLQSSTRSSSTPRRTYEDGYRRIVLEFVLTLTDNRAGLVRSHAGLVEGVTYGILQMLAEHERDPSIEDELFQTWSSCDDAEDVDCDEYETNPFIGEQSLDRWALKIKGKVLIPILFPAISELLRSKDWRQRHAGLIAISSVAEGCLDAMRPHLAQLVGLVLPHLSDIHPRVRYAALTSLGQMATDFHTAFQTQFHATLVPALVTTLGDTHPRVAAQAAAALINFGEGCEIHLLTLHANTIFTALYTLLSRQLATNTGRKIILEHCITAVSALADAVGDAFTPFYDTFVKTLLQIMALVSASSTDSTYTRIRGKTMECISLIGLAVGPDKFREDAFRLIRMLTETRLDEMEADDPQNLALLHTWARLCKCLDAEFVPFLTYVMPHLLKNAQLKPDLAILELTADPEAQETEYQQAGYEIIQMDNARYGVRTLLLENKKIACEMLGIYVRQLRSAFRDYLGPVLDTLLPLAHFYFHEGVREASLNALPSIIEAMVECHFPDYAYFFAPTPAIPGQLQAILLPTHTLKENKELYLSHLFGLESNPSVAAILQTARRMVDEILSTLQSEPIAEIASQLIYCLRRILDLLGPQALKKLSKLGTNCYGTLTECLDGQLEQAFERFKARMEARVDPECDDQLLEELNEEQQCDNAVTSEVSYLLHSLFKLHPDSASSQDRRVGADVLAIYRQLSKHFVLMTNSVLAHPDCSWAICTFCDLVQYAPTQSTEFAHAFWPAIIAGMQSETDPEHRQSACYAIGIIAQYGGPLYKAQLLIPQLSQITAMLLKIVQADDAKDSNNIYASDAAVSAIGKLLQFVPSQNEDNLAAAITSSIPNGDQLLETYLHQLPITTDYAEAATALAYLVALIANNHPLFSTQPANLILAAKVIAHDYNREWLKEANPQLNTRLKQVIDKIITLIPNFASSLDDEHRLRLAAP